MLCPGAEPYMIYLSVTPHVEPTHTLYDADGERFPPRYGTWREGVAGDPAPDLPTAALADAYAAAAERLAELARRNAEEARRLAAPLAGAADAHAADKATMDALWLCLRDVVEQVEAMEAAWNRLAPRAMPTPDEAAGS